MHSGNNNNLEQNGSGEDLPGWDMFGEQNTPNSELDSELANIFEDGILDDSPKSIRVQSESLSPDTYRLNEQENVKGFPFLDKEEIIDDLGDIRFKSKNDEFGRIKISEAIRARLVEMVWYFIDREEFSSANFVSAKLVALEPKHGYSVYLEGLIHYKQGHYQGCYQLFQSKKIQFLLPESIYLFAKTCFQLRNFQEAEQLLKYMLNLPLYDFLLPSISGSNFRVEKPDKSSIYLLLGDTFKANYRTSKAAEHYMLAWSSNPYCYRAFDELCKLGEVIPDKEYIRSSYASLSKPKNLSFKKRKVHIKRSVSHLGSEPKSQDSFSFEHSISYKESFNSSQTSLPSHYPRASVLESISNSNAPTNEPTTAYSRLPNKMMSFSKSNDSDTLSPNNLRRLLSGPKSLLKNEFNLSSDNGSTSEEENEIEDPISPGTGLPRVKTMVRAPTASILHNQLKRKATFVKGSGAIPRTISCHLPPLSNSDKTIEIAQMQTLDNEDLIFLDTIFFDFFRGKALLAINEGMEAIETFKSLPTSIWESNPIKLQIARCHMATGNYIDACKIFQEIYNKNSYMIDGLNDYALALWHTDDTVQLANMSDQARNANPKSLEYYLFKSQGLSLESRLLESLHVLEIAELDYPDSFEPFLYSGHELLALGRPQEAVLKFRSAIRLFPRSHSAYYGLGKALYDLEEDDSEILLCMKNAYKYNPNQLSVISLYISTLIRSELYYQAKEVITSSLLKFPDNPLLTFMQARFQAADNQLEQATETLYNLLGQMRNEGLVNYMLGKCLYLQHRHSEALIQLNLASHRYPKIIQINQLIQNIIQDSTPFPSTKDELFNFFIQDDSDFNWHF